MSYLNPPTKPPRGVKQPRESSGLLMSVIRTLSASESNEQRDREKAKLEKEYKKSDKRLDELVSVHDEDLNQVMQSFDKISTNVLASRDKIRSVKENLIACKMLLRCKREELKKLWLEGVEQKHTLFLLEEIDKIRDVPSKITGHISKKHYLHATQLLVKSLTMASGSLKDIGALTDVFAELRNKSKQLNSVLMNELSQQLYRNPSKQAEVLRRQGSGLRGSGRAKAPPPMKKGVDIGPQMQVLSPTSHPDEAYSSLSEDLNNDNPDQEPERFVSILAECLALLGKLPEAIETLKMSMQIELAAVVNQTSAQLCSSGLFQQGNAMLLELLSTLFDQFRAIAATHSSAIQSLRRAAEKYKVETRFYEVTEVWSNIQVVLEQLLENYLDMQNNSGKEMQPAAVFNQAATHDLSAFFARRKPQKPKRATLFKFDSSAKSFGSPQRESTQNSLSNAKNMVCSPNANNITTIFIPLMKFVEEIEQATGMHAVRNPCHMRGFLKEFVDQDFVPRQQMAVANKIDQVTRVSDAWKAITSADQTTEMNLIRPLLQSCVNVEKCVQELRKTMGALPTYSELFLAVMCNRLTGYRETCQAAYRGIVQPDVEDRKFVSVDWLNDDDISRCLKFLPNWVDLQKQRKANQQLNRNGSVEEEHPDDIKQKNLQEAEILVRNFGGRAILSHEILSDMSQLKRLAQLQESMEWFASKLSEMASGLPKMNPGATTHSIPVGEIPPMQPKNVEDLERLAQEFEELSNTCLLILHLEIRVQCFHYLLPGGYSIKTVNGITSSEDLEPRVLQLSRAVNVFDEALSSTIQPNKAKYVFDGLGHLISKILITSVQYTNQLDEPGVQKICRNILSLQQTLASVTMSREVGLDHARHYFELFYMTPEEVLVTVMEKGPQFQELEYINALQLLHRNRGDSPTTINEHLKRLSDIMRNMGVTV
ncbi:exocyst complex component 4 [Neocloeon triangulifer]|uniref:exocyst complex component 4 n=1 Tax=Neocloeon triangulifer TaxID=2078957 RepID=UPI00286F9E62|nr:exocyst complex component 4 [Neocloeon triangulifer]